MFYLIFTLLIIPLKSFANYSTQSIPTYELSYYAEESNKYFDTLDSYAPIQSKPKYSNHVIRWEWYPWLFLTGHGKESLKLDRFLLYYPTKVINRKCQGFKVQPFGRCHVTFHYLKGDHLVDIYEEFTFNEKGEITFIEAWTDKEEFLPMKKTDYWAQAKNIKRLSTRIPGLGDSNGNYDYEKLKSLAPKDKDIKNLLKRLRHPILYWFYEAARFVFKRD